MALDTKLFSILFRIFASFSKDLTWKKQNISR